MDCHTPEAHREGGNLYQMMQEAKPVTRGLRDATMMNVVRKKKRSLHEATPRKGRKEPNRLAVRNQKNTKNVGKDHLYDTVRYRTQTGYITGFTGKAAYVQTFEGVYIKPEGKIYKQISLSELKLLRHNNNWIQWAGA